MVGKANVAKHFMPDPKPYYYDDPNSFFPKKNNGEKFHIFFRNDDSKTYLAELSIYKSGHIEITNIPAKKNFKFDELNELKSVLETGRVWLVAIPSRGIPARELRSRHHCQLVLVISKGFNLPSLQLNEHVASS